MEILVDEDLVQATHRDVFCEHCGTVYRVSIGEVVGLAGVNEAGQTVMVLQVVEPQVVIVGKTLPRQGPKIVVATTQDLKEAERAIDAHREGGR
ncbi:hypothetical protein D3C86_1922940 [compost metagenome]